MMLAETIAARQFWFSIVLAIAAVLLAIAWFTLRFVQWRKDSEDDGFWVMALDPQKYNSPWDSLFDCAVRTRRICGASYLSLILPRKDFTALENEMAYAGGIASGSEKEIQFAIDKAKRDWGRHRVWTIFPSIRRRLEEQLTAFCEIANFAKEKDLILLCILLENIDSSDAASNR